MVKYTLFFMIGSDGHRVYYVELGQWLIARFDNVVVLMHGIITQYHFSEYKKAGKLPLFFDTTLKCWMIENAYNEEYYKTIDPDRSRMFVTWLHQTDRKEVFSNEN